MKVKQLINYLKKFNNEDEIFWLNVGQDTGDLIPFEEEVFCNEDTKRFIIKNKKNGNKKS